ncbi:cytochrome-c peroxidase [Vineibacter terrae]|uniref:cytochrome-c peroxidase n=1 Tax=Vineibacter terrae TaxID=2586908 RepID=UPI002E36DA0C|nr:cytochrome c peroxidase [Vineibacter terrae]HEX2886504.1 cytochrome c peroxidase [Vineibacter terrae]
MTITPFRLAAGAWLVAAILGPLLAWTAGHADPPATGSETAPITPVPHPAGLDAAKVKLGDSLFHDRRLSHGDVVACAECHRLDAGGDDDRAHAMGSDGRPLDFNAPTIFNATLSFRFNWRGNFRALETQNESTLRDRRLMNASWDELLAKLNADASYRAAFDSAYRGPPARAHVLDALASFQRSLLTPDARFDRYLRGEADAITTEEKRGYELFRAYGCTACHQGVNIGGNLFQKFGIFDDPFARRARITAADLGRFTITGDARDRHVFRVPSLRNVALTAPYFHDGSAETLQEAVEVMARSQLGRTVEAQDIDLIVKFLGTLTGDYRRVR